MGQETTPFQPVPVTIGGRQTYARTKNELQRLIAAGGTADDAADEALPYEQEYRARAGERNVDAFVQGVSSGLTAGLSDDQGYEASVTREENPLVYGGGTALGLVGGAVAGVGAPGLAAKAGAMAGARVASPVARLATEGAVDGLAYATTRESVGAIVHDKPFSVEAIAVEGALGGGIGGALGLAAKGAGSLRKALTKEDIASDTVTRVMSGLDGEAAAVDTAPSIPDGTFDSTLPAPSSATARVPSGRQVNVDISPVPSLEEPAKFYRSMPHMQKADESLHAIWKEIDALEDDIARLPGDAPGFDELNAEWRALKADRAKLAQKVGGKSVSTERLPGLQRNINRWVLPDSPIASKMDPRKPVKNQEIIDAYEAVILSARRIDDKLVDIRKLGDINSHIDVAADVRGASARLGDKLTREEAAAAVTQRRADYAKEMAGRERSDSDDLIGEIFARDMGSLGQKLGVEKTKVSNLKQFKGIESYSKTPGVRQTADAERDAILGYTVPEAWNRTDARPVEVIKKSLKAGEPPHLEELLMLDKAEQRVVLDSLSQRHIDSLAAEAYASPKVITYRAASESIAGPAAAVRSDIVGKLEEDILMSRLQPPAPPPVERPALRAAVEPDSPLSGSAPVASSGVGVIDLLRRTNMSGILMASMFPKMAIAKAVIEKYGARIAGAAESALSNRAVSLTLRKIPALPWANVLAPGGSEQDRNLRAVAEAAKNPAAFDAAVEKAMANIDSDNPEKMVAARERISANIQYLIRNMPPTLSALKPVWSPSSVVAFNVLMRAFADPVGVFEDAATAPTEQLNAAKEMYPETYMHWMTELVNRVSQAAAEGKPVPRSVGRFLPMASPAWSPEGMSMLQAVTTQKVQGGQGGQMNSSIMAPKTDVESMSQNRIGLNK